MPAAAPPSPANAPCPGLRRTGGRCGLAAAEQVTGLAWLRTPLRALMLALALTLALTAAPASAAEPTPRAEPDWPWSPALAQPGLDGPAKLLREAMLPYADGMPALRRLEWNELRDNALRPRTWNPAFERFTAQCAPENPACMALVRGQLAALYRAQASAETEARWQPLVAPIASAIADLCSTRLGQGDNFGQCGLSQRLNEAGFRWLAAGQDLLAQHYLDRYEQQRRQFLDWQREQPDPQGTAAASAQRALPALPVWVAAMSSELSGSLGAARWSWLMTFSQSMEGQSAPSLASILSLVELARLSQRLGETELAQALADLPEARGGPAASCLLNTARARLALARAHAQDRWPDEAEPLLAQLKTSGCPYTPVVLELAVDAFLRGDVADPALQPRLRRLLDAELAECARAGDCAPYRLAQMQALAQAGWGPLAQWGELLASRLEVHDQLALPPAPELRLDWALGRAMLERPGTSPAQRAQALQLLQAVQAKPVLQAKLDLTASQETQRNLSRYDGLHRLIARAQVQQGQALPLASSEVLRAQTLLRRLRLQRLAQELAGERNAEAEAQFRRIRAEVDALRSRANAAGNPVVSAWLRRLGDDALATAETARLETLAARKLERLGERRSGWLDRLQGGALSSLLEPGTDRWNRQEGDRLAPDEAYLSWLQVPDGFVATVLLREAGAAPRLSSHWVPFGAVQQANLKLWRDLLRTGSAQPDPVGGLLLRGRPLWRQPDGLFVAANEAPPQARRVQQASELAQALGEHLLAGLPPEALARARLVISPDGPLAQLPFESLWWQGQPLTRGRDLSYVQSLAVWEELQRRAQARQAGQTRLLSLAQPSYALPAAAADGARGAAPSASAPASEPEWMTELDWPELPGTGVESTALRALYRPGGQQLLGRDASLQRLMQLQQKGQLSGFQLLHFATHGYVDDERSALVLSMHQGREPAYLLDSQIAQLSLNSSLVLLSACETGLGRQQSGEGVMGLPYAFMLAGNVDTLMSLWSVDDRGTAAFVSAYMARVAKGQDVVAALNATKRDFQDGRHGQDMRDPRIWAAFVLYGVPLKLPAS